MENYYYQAKEANVSELVTNNSQMFINSIKRYVIVKRLLKWGGLISFFVMIGIPFFVVFFILCIIGSIIHNNFFKVKLKYPIDEYNKNQIQLFNQAMSTLMNNNAIWQINTIQANASAKVNAGATSNVNKKIIKFKKKKPFFLHTNATCYYIKLKDNKVFILPDRLIVKGKQGWGVVEHSELRVDVGEQNFIEDSRIPRDAKIEDYTWQYVNKDGSPDRRYNNNRQVPVCQYGELRFKSATGLNIIIYISNVENVQKFKMLASQMRKARKLNLLG